jgi:hypothetical protein
MSRAINAQTRVAIVAETSPGTIPATPAWQVLRVTGETLAVDRKIAKSNELNGYRGEKNAVISQRMGAGSIKGEWTYGTFDVLLQSALRNVWTTNVISDANTPATFAAEVTYNEGGAGSFYKRLLGTQVDKLAITMKAGAVVTTDVTVKALDADFFNALFTGATYVVGNTNPILVGANVASLTLTSSPATTLDVVPEISMTISNSLKEYPTLGQLALADLGAGKLEVTGAIQCIVSDADYQLVRDAADLVPFALTFVIGTTSGSRYQVNVPNVILETPKVESQSIDGDVMFTANWRGLQSTTIGNSVIQITRAY